jgi:hypothetical protein
MGMRVQMRLTAIRILVSVLLSFLSPVGLEGNVGGFEEDMKWDA